MQLAFPLELGRPRFDEHLSVLAEAGAQQVPLYFMQYDNRPTPCEPGPDCDMFLQQLTAHHADIRRAGLDSEVLYMDFRLKPADIVGSDPRAAEWFRLVCARCAELGIATLGFFPSNPLRQETDDTWDAAQVAGYRAMADIAAPVGIRLASHINMTADSRFGLAADVESWLQAVDRENVGLLFCFGCVALAGLDLATMIRRWQDRVFVVHLRDIVGSWRDGNSERQYGQGEVDLPSAIAALREIGYTGILHPEHFPASVAEPPIAERALFAHAWDRGLIATTWSLGFWRGMLAGSDARAVNDTHESPAAGA